jgi:hypothetical protein
MAACASFLDDLLHNLKDKQREISNDEASYGNSPSEEDLGYLVEKYKASFDYFIQDIQAAVDRMPQNNAAAPALQGNANNGNPSNQSQVNRNNSNVNNPRGGKRKKHRTKKHRK